jgi:hypothetical protein
VKELRCFLNGRSRFPLTQLPELDKRACGIASSSATSNSTQKRSA